jgi:Mg2+/citrate symporter
MFTFTSVSLNLKIHLSNKPVHTQGTFFLYTLLCSDTEINMIRVANPNPEVMSNIRLNNAAIYRSARPDLYIGIAVVTCVLFNILRVIKSRRVN